ncbi:venom allergen 5-like [Diabrotica undecimpunctata]|uniref:venom allergen 5-like n=1 Tax=Diabrotica undecimpunctata TaxID=50387 RepID=UPI003B63699B
MEELIKSLIIVGETTTKVTNRELESIAQCLTNTCNFAHDKCRRTAQWSWVGQNLGIRWTKGYVENVRSVITDVINSWYNEVKDFRSWGVSRYGFNARVGHYTQQVWANTDHIGCAITFFVNSDGWKHPPNGLQLRTRG